jgi:hypothetical protein
MQSCSGGCPVQCNVMSLYVSTKSKRWVHVAAVIMLPSKLQVLHVAQSGLLQHALRSLSPTNNIRCFLMQYVAAYETAGAMAQTIMFCLDGSSLAASQVASCNAAWHTCAAIVLTSA